MSELNAPLVKIIGSALVYSSMQYAIASVALSSTFSTINFCKDQKTLQGASDCLVNYLQVGSVWMIGTVLVMFATYGLRGGFWALLTNLLIMGWVYRAYWRAFRIAAKRNKLELPYMNFWDADEE